MRTAHGTGTFQNLYGNELFNGSSRAEKNNHHPGQSSPWFLFVSASKYPFIMYLLATVNRVKIIPNVLFK